MSIFEAEQRDENINERLRALAAGDLPEQGPSAESILAAGMLTTLRKLDELSDAVDELKAQAG
jgi:hypothetical protein